jgi:hypothetical protein
VAKSGGMTEPSKDLRLQDFFIVHDGRHGIFVPLGKDGELLPEPGTGGEELAALRREVVRLTEENLQLKKKLETMERPPTSPDDLASALQGAVDSLQGRLSSLDNPVSNFAVKEFRLEAQVRVDVNALGQIGYRFARPGENEALSRLTLDLVPLPKPSSDGPPPACVPLSILGLDSIEGLTQEARRVLHENQIFSVQDFLTAGTRVRSRVELRRLLGEERERLGLCLAQAELLSVPGLTPPVARVLSEAGFRGLADLAASSSGTVAVATRSKSAEAKGREAISAAKAEELIQAAQKLSSR